MCWLAYSSLPSWLLYLEDWVLLGIFHARTPISISRVLAIGVVYNPAKVRPSPSAVLGKPGAGVALEEPTIAIVSRLHSYSFPPPLEDMALPW